MPVWRTNGAAAVTTDIHMDAALADDEYRIEGRSKVSGEAAYSADAHLSNMLYAAFAKSVRAHARIVSVDVAAAAAAPGVRAVLTGADVGGARFGRQLLDWPVLATERVRFIGEYVAAVAAETLTQARAAVDLIEITYEELPAVFTPAEALLIDATTLHEYPATYRFLAGVRMPPKHPNIQGEDSCGQGDVERAFRSAARILEHRFTTPSMHTGYIEPRATVVWIDADGFTHVISTSKTPYALRQQMAVTIAVAPERIIIEPVLIGGDFGGKGLSIDEFPCYYLARATGRPVKAVRTYLEDIQSTSVRHAADIVVKSAIDEKGKWSGLQMTVLFDGGAYAAGKPIPHLVPGLGPKTPYHVPNTRIERICVYTNTVPGAHVRAPSDVQVFFALESHVDLLAQDLNEDPLAFRMRHAIRGTETDVDGLPYHEPHAVDVLAALKGELSWLKPLGPGRGRGVAISARHIGGGKTSAKIALRADGTVHVRAGMVENGAGAMTMVQRIVAAELGCPRSSVFVHRTSTADAPPEGGAGASKVTNILGHVALRGAAELIAAMRAALAERHDIDVTGVAFSAGAFTVEARKYAWDEVARIACGSGEIERTIAYDSAAGTPHGSPEAANFCAFAVTVTVDTETGATTIDDVLCIADVGAVINPIAHRGQIDGGFIWGVGHALMEELVLEDGKILNLSLADYKIPTIADIPPLRVIEVAHHDGPGPYGAKAAGEISTAAVAPAIANAIAAATGARLFDLPLTAERVYHALHSE
jgi:CO/xanthine dehydrogenase Mo-binding subunit